MLAAAALAAATLGATPAQAADTVVAHDLAVSAADRQAVLDYWTPERIAAMPTGPSTPGAPPADGPDGAGFPAGTAVDRTIGRLFFVDRGEDESCTATLVAAVNRSTIVTAGHCVHGMDLIGNDPQWTDKVLFVPGFRDHTRPYGSFVARTAFADTTWVADDQQNDHDQAFLVLNPDEHGRRATDVTRPRSRSASACPATCPRRSSATRGPRNNPVTRAARSSPDSASRTAGARRRRTRATKRSKCHAASGGCRATWAAAPAAARG